MFDPNIRKDNRSLSPVLIGFVSLLQLKVFRKMVAEDRDANLIKMADNFRALNPLNGEK